MIREKLFEKKHWQGVVHTTWNPSGPGVIRIHLVPPAFTWGSYPPSLVILNGQEILPLNESWAILLTVFIEKVNAFGPREMGSEDMDRIMKSVYRDMRKVYPKVPKDYLKEDLLTMVGVFEDVIHHKKLPEEIGLLSIGEYASRMSAPHRMDLMISSMKKDGAWHCNQQCVHCYAAGQPQAEMRELSTEDWKKIIANCRLAKIPQLTFTGGEPTLREDLCELIHEARWFVTRLNTNGVLLTEKLCRDLVQAELDSVQITFYSHDRDVHNALVGGDHYDQTVAGIKNAVAAGLNVSVNTPLCRENKDYEETLRFLKELGVIYFTCSGMIETGNATTETSRGMQLAKDEITEVLKKATTYAYANGLEINFTSPGWVDKETLTEMGLDVPACGACLSNMAVTPDGKVIPCQSWLSETPLGDMLNDPWERIWKKKRCKEIRAYSAKMTGTCPFREGMNDEK